MKVWIVEYDDGDYNNIFGVYSSSPKAYEAIRMFLTMRLEEILDDFNECPSYKKVQTECYDSYIKELDRHYEKNMDSFYGGCYYAEAYELDN